MSDLDIAVAQLSAAIRDLSAAGDRRGAAMACAQLGDLMANAMGNLTAARAWFARAARLVDDLEPCVEQGWVAVAAMGCDVDDPDELLARAELALDRARRFGDVSLETKALADAGLAHVQLGRLETGMALLDEAMALACGSADADSAGKSVCSFFTACYHAADFERAGSWVASLRQHGLIGKAGMIPLYLSNHCDSVQASLLGELGRWSDAEALLVRAIDEFESGTGLPIAAWHPAIELADLRIRQGRLADAEALLLGKDAHLQALLPAARLHLARRDHELARATARRGIRAIANDRLRSAELYAVVARAELGLGDHDAAAAAVAELESRSAGLAVPSLQARVAAVRAELLAATGDLSAAIAIVERTVEGLDAAGSPWLQVCLLLDLARWREEAGDRAGATVEAKGAVATLAELDVVLAARDVALLERLGVTVTVAGAAATLRREGKWWEAAYRDTRVRIPDSKGMRYVAELVANPGSERHALDLVDRVEGVAEIDRRRLGDAGQVMDGQARAAYRRRIEALRSEIDDALAVGDEDGALQRQAEIDQLLQQLAQAFGLGGRPRRSGSTAERARLNVTRAVRTATAKLCEALPDAGAALDRGIRTGLYCVYQTAPGETIRWTVR